MNRLTRKLISGIAVIGILLGTASCDVSKKGTEVTESDVSVSSSEVIETTTTSSEIEESAEPETIETTTSETTEETTMTSETTTATTTTSETTTETTKETKAKDLSPEWVRNLSEAKDPGTTQLLIVAASGMNKTTAKVSMHERDEDGDWIQILSVDGYVGKNGMVKDSERKEGCGKTPIGVYYFTTAFGIADDPGCKIPYIKVTKDLYWSSDMREGMHYNEMVSINDYPNLDKKNSEHLIDYTKAYQYCLNISFNEECTPGRGSAIFLHCTGNNKYTAGCVAVPKDTMVKIMKRVDPFCVVVIDTKDNLGA